MSYRSSDQTGDTTDRGDSGEMPPIRKLTESQGARSAAYELGEETGRTRLQVAVGPLSQRTLPAGRRETAQVAAQEHIRRLLRQADETTQELWTSTDPRDSALAGARLVSILQDLWALRGLREDDWGSGINLLQIVLARLEFEELRSSQRRALHRVFEEGILARSVGRAEMARIIQVLSEAGFDVWRGLEEAELGEG